MHERWIKEQISSILYSTSWKIHVQSFKSKKNLHMTVLTLCYNKWLISLQSSFHNNKMSINCTIILHFLIQIQNLEEMIIIWNSIIRKSKRIQSIDNTCVKLNLNSSVLTIYSSPSGCAYKIFFSSNRRKEFIGSNFGPSLI